MDFRLTRPSGQLSNRVQGIWSASVTRSALVMKPLYSDAGSGVIFNLSGDLIIGDQVMPEGVIMLPTKKTAELLGPNYLDRTTCELLGPNYLDSHG